MPIIAKLPSIVHVIFIITVSIAPLYIDLSDTEDESHIFKF